MILGYLLPKENSFEFKHLVDGSYINYSEADNYTYSEFVRVKIVC
jgi:hypothetical protein